jgi:flagellar basal body-associated protein FliL
VRKRSLILLLFPIILILWTIGWAFLWAGEQQTSQKQETPDNIHITVHLPEEEQKILQ